MQHANLAMGKWAKLQQRTDWKLDDLMQLTVELWVFALLLYQLGLTAVR